MPRAFWYNLAAALSLCAFSTLIAVNRGTYQENVLYGVFFAPDTGPSPAGLILMCAVLAFTALLGMRITGGTRAQDLFGLFGLALFVPFTFLASRFWADTLAVLLLAGAVLSVLDPARDFKSLAFSFVLMLLAVVVRGQLAFAPVAVAAYLLVSRRAKAGLMFAALIALAYFAALRLHIGAAGDMRFLGLPFSRFHEAYSARGLADVFRWSLEVQLLSAFMPFLLAAWTGLSVGGIPQDRPALFLILSLSLLPLSIIPGIMPHPESARLMFMAASVFTLLGASSGASLLCKPMAGVRSLRWGIAVGGIFLMPSVISFF